MSLTPPVLPLDFARGQPLHVVMLALTIRGGMAHYSSQLAQALAPHVRVTLVVLRGYDRSQLPPDVETVEMDLAKSIAGRLHEVREVLHVLRPDVLHITSYHYLQLGLFDLFRRWPVVVTVHDAEVHSGERSLINLLLNGYHKRVATVLLTHGERSRQSMLDAGIKAPIRVIPHGSYNFLADQPSPPGPDADAALFFGRIVRYKGLDVFERAIRAAQNGKRPIMGYVAGAGPIEVPGIRDSSLFVLRNSFVSEDELPGIMRRCFALVCPYHTATQSGVITLAYAFGRPVIATRVGDIPDVVQEGVTGFLVDPGDHEGIARAMRRLRDDPELAANMGRAGRRFAETELGPERVARLTLDAYVEAQGLRRVHP